MEQAAQAGPLLAEGWGVRGIPGSAKIHYFIDGRPLCGRGPEWHGPTMIRMPSGMDQCTWCWMRKGR